MVKLIIQIILMFYIEKYYFFIKKIQILIYLFLILNIYIQNIIN